MAMAAVGSQLASVLALSSAQKVSTSGSTKSSIMLSLRIGMPIIECAKHAQKKATAHHVKTRPKKHQPYDKNRQGPTLYPAVAKAPPIWGFDTGDVIPDVWDVRQPREDPCQLLQCGHSLFMAGEDRSLAIIQNL